MIYFTADMHFGHRAIITKQTGQMDREDMM